MRIPMMNNPELFAIIDDTDFELINKYKWYAIQTTKKKTNKTTYYAYANCYENNKKTTISMHTLLMNPNHLPNMHVDHCPDRNGLNNSRSNLILCTPITHLNRHWHHRLEEKIQNPKESNKFKTVCYNLRLVDQAHLQLLAIENDCSASAMLRKLIKMAMKAQEDK